MWSSNCFNVTWCIKLNVVLPCSVCYKRVTLELTADFAKLHVFTNPVVNTASCS